MKYLILITSLVLSLLVIGCAQSRFDDGYQFGDITMSLTDLGAIYCSDVSEDVRRAAAKAIKSQTGLYPSDGACGAAESVKERLQ